MKMSQSKLKVGLVGGIGSGKSYVASRLLSLGFPVYSTDEAAKILMETSPEIRKGLIALLGEGAYHEDGRLNKSVIAAFLFENDGHAKKINAIVHPVVAKDFQRWVSLQQEHILFMECAILYESGFDVLVDRVCLVTAPQEIRLRRVMQRDGFSKEEVCRRMERQLRQEELLSRVHYIIENDGETDVEGQLQAVLAQLNERIHAC